MLRDTQGTCPVGNGVKVAHRRPVLDPANLRLGKPKPVAEHFLRDAVLAKARDVERMLPVRTCYPAHVLGCKSVTELVGVPEVGRQLRRYCTLLDDLSLAGAASRARAVVGEALAALTVPVGGGTHRDSACLLSSLR